MQQAHRTRMQPPAASFHVISPKPMLVPPVVNRLNVSGEHQQKRRQRTQLVNPLFPLQFHPVLNPPPVLSASPFHHIHYHHTGVEIARGFR
ncbi:hypothetical protein HanRHA438_Chr12g0554761 [Helianthus annuus]|nr:hypothetical protein HanIR_Chr12g0585851 [Helianthus annuus]KAJ0866698.1 hypothetical protein HanRHA438_Chr12g0554761 [Helianthus annuus]